MEWLEVTAPSVESAKELALDRLGVHRSDAEFEVLTEGRLGLFGRVKEQARVRARILPAPVRPKTSRGRRGRRTRSSGRPSATPAGDAGQQPGRRKQSAGGKVKSGSAKSAGIKTGGVSSQRSVGAAHNEAGNPRKDNKKMTAHDTGLSLADQADLAEAFVSGVAEVVGISLTFVRHDLRDGVMRIEAQGDDLGLLIGRRGITARALDDLVRTVLRRAGGTTLEGKIRMDIGGLRERRRAALTAFVKRVAGDAVESGDEIALEPMNRVDRKIVHDAVAEINGAASRSEGLDPQRRVVISAVANDL